MVTLRILGECAIEVGRARLGPDSQILFATLLYLTLDPGRRVPRQEMTDVLWPGTGDDSARHNLRQTVYRLRQMGATIDTEGGHVAAPADSVCAPHETLATDAGLEAIFARTAPPVGPVLPGYASGLSDRLDEWVDHQRTLIHGRIRRALVAAVERYRARGRWGEVEVLARNVLAIDPLNEEATLVMAESAALSGSKQYALTILDRYLAEIGPEGRDIRLPAAVLRRRISERLPEPRWRAVSEAAFVGRADSMELLGKLLQAARGGEGAGVLLWGEPGIGKTRLADELWKVAALQANTQLAKVCCQPSDARRPLSVFADVVPDLQKLPGALGCAPRSVALLKRLTEYDVNAEGPSEDAREAEYLYASIKRSIFDLVDAVQEDQCLVLVIEDVHWLDAESWKILREMIPWAARRRLLFVLTSRTPHATDTPDEETPKFLVKHRVGPIDADAAVTLVELMVRERERVPDAAFRDWSVSVAEGNPFFLRELTTYWLQTGTAYQVPASLQALIDDRLDRLSPNATQLLQATSVLGANASLARLEELIEMPFNALIAAASELETAGMIQPTAAGVSAKHHLLAQACLRKAQTIALRLMHRRAAGILEREDVRTSSALVWDCAAHWESGGDHERSLAYLRRAARHLLEIGLPQQATEILERLRGSTSEPHELLEVLSDLGHALWFAGSWRRAHDCLMEAKALRAEMSHATAAPHPDDLLLLDAETQAGRNREDTMRSACSLALSAQVSSAFALGAGLHAMVLTDTCGAFDAMTSVFFHLDSLAVSTDEERAALAHIRVIYHCTSGDPRQAVDAAVELTAIRDRKPASPPVRARARYAMAVALFRAGREDDARRSARDCVEFARANGIPYLQVAPLVTMANWSVGSGRTAEASSLLAEASGALDRSNYGAWSEEFDFVSARVSLAVGDHEAARTRLAAFEPMLLTDSILRRRVNIQAAWLDLLLLEGEDAHATELFSDFQRSVHHCITRCNMDYPLTVFTRVLQAHGDQDGAERLLRGYVSSARRELGPLPSTLAVLLRDVHQ
jgi:DNA-binding SARP family transcriptional activator